MFGCMFIANAIVGTFFRVHSFIWIYLSEDLFVGGQTK